MVDIVGNQKNDPDIILDMLGRAADELHTVEVTEQARATLNKRLIANTNRKSVNQGKPEADGNKSTPGPTEVC